jgi:nitrite reductase/ring-hydroxylating ferredoxin subunit
MTAEGATVSEGEWIKLEGLSTENQRWPARAQLADESILIFLTRYGLRGVERYCPHMKASLHMGILVVNDTVIRCPSHNIFFKLDSGDSINSPGLCLKVYDVKVEGGSFYGRAASQPAAQATQA